MAASDSTTQQLKSEKLKTRRLTVGYGAGAERGHAPHIRIMGRWVEEAGFAIGAVLFLPFLLIDMVTASITTSIGMFQLPPVVVSTPLKILLFVMVDGWNLLASSLLKSF